MYREGSKLSRSQGEQPKWQQWREGHGAGREPWRPRPGESASQRLAKGHVRFAAATATATPEAIMNEQPICLAGSGIDHLSPQSYVRYS